MPDRCFVYAQPLFIYIDGVGLYRRRVEVVTPYSS